MISSTVVKKIGGRPMKATRSSKVWNYINKYNLIDLGFKGCKFTWSNHRRRNNGLLMERLDRVLANEEWLNILSNSTVTHLPKTYSDHNPILVKLNNSYNNSKRPFRLKKYMVHPPRLP